jgi:exonuclease V gamma subunit
LASADRREPATNAVLAGVVIAAALDIQLPARFLWSAYRSVLGADAWNAQASLRS